MQRKHRRSVNADRLVRSNSSAALVQALESRVLLSTFTVTNNSDNGNSGTIPGSLRWAINQSNNTPGKDTIAFNLPAGSRVIKVVGAKLPDIWDSAIVDATTQPGYAGKPLVQVDGTSLPANISAFKLYGSSTLKGFSITNFTTTAVDIPSPRAGYGGNVVQRNWVGLDLNGNAAGSTGSGIGVFGPNNLIGGATRADGNVVSASKGALGIHVMGPANGNNTIQNNFIGTDPTGKLDRGNKKTGLGIQDSPNNQVLNNVISGNGEDGIVILGANANGNTVKGNFVGLDATGANALGNDWWGLEIQTANNVVGGTTPAERNVFSANGQTGVVLYLSSAKDNLIQGNYVGTDVTGTQDRGNVYQGIAVATGAQHNTIKGNLVSGNDKEGIGIFPGHYNTVQGNTIGMTATGQHMPNATWAVTVISSNGNIIGGSGAGQPNVISANHPNKPVISGGHTTNNIGTNTIVTGTTPVPIPGSFAFSSAAYQANETGGTATVTVTRTANTNVAASVNYATSNGTAQAGSDYTAASGTLNFAAGETSKTFSVQILNDGAAEVPETVALALSNSTGGATIATPSSAVLTIVSEDVADATPPRILSARFDNQTAPQKLTYTFSENVAASLALADVMVINTITNQSHVPSSAAYNAASQTATFTFAAPLPSGNYRSTLVAAGVVDAAGNRLDGNGDSLAGGDHTLNFFHLTGDATRDGMVNFDDLVVIAQNYNTAVNTFSQGDFNYDGNVAFADLALLAQQYNTALPGAPLSAPSGASVADAAVEPAAVVSVSARKPKARFSARRIS